MKIVSVVGARPEFIQATQVSRALRAKHQETLIHTGQHYDLPLSQTFFDELEIHTPDFNLEVGSGSHTRQTGEIMFRLEEVLLKERPDLVMVRGDTNSTLASALVASKLHIPLAHIEAGERSFNRRMPEEINRLVTDKLANFNFCASQTAVGQLASEGITESVHWVGDVMLDAMLHYKPIAHHRSNVMGRLNLAPGGFCLVTIHRVGNTDDPERLCRIIQILNETRETIIFPVHPRTAKVLTKIKARFGEHVKLIEPVGYLDMILLEENARLIATDSGGVQREAYFLGVPCLTLRDETEWIETVESGWNKVVGVDHDVVFSAWQNFNPPKEHPPIFGDGTASQRIANVLGREGLLSDHPVVRGEGAMDEQVLLKEHEPR
jgi:UDP-GlcNAc3NAcA epimerase